MIDLKELKRQIATMTPNQKIYKLIKAELEKQGHWREDLSDVAVAGGVESLY